MSRKAQSKSVSIVAVVLAIVIVAVVSGLGVSLYRSISGLFADMPTTGAPFTVYQGESETPFDQDVSGVEILETETFTVKHSGEDAEIKATLTPLTIEGDYAFKLSGTSNGAWMDCTYSWNSDVYGFEAKTFGQYFDIKIDQEANTVTVSGTTSKALEKYSKTQFSDAVLSLPVIPQADMYCLAITTGNKTMKINCMIRSKATGVQLSQGHHYFEAI